MHLRSSNLLADWQYPKAIDRNEHLHNLDVMKTYYNQLTFDRPKSFIPTQIHYHCLTVNMNTLFPFHCCKFSALDTWNSPARPPLKAQGSWSPLRNCAEDWLRHPVGSRSKRTLLPQDGALWHRWNEWGNGEKMGLFKSNIIIHLDQLIFFSSWKYIKDLLWNRWILFKDFMIKWGLSN